MKKILSMVLVIALVAGIAISGTMAYLTDRDNETNVFTVGDVDIELDGDFADEFELLPGKTFTTNPLIKNVGKNAAWVWLTYAVPTDLASVVNISAPLGDKWEAAASYDFDVKVDIDEDGTPEADYKAFVLAYEKALAVDTDTTAAFETIGLASSVDVTPEGEWYSVVDGDPTKLNWNTETDGAPYVFINAYAIQQDLFDDVYDAIDAYKLQWGSLNGKYEISAPADVWDGTADISWYEGNEDATEFELTTAEQLAGLAKLVDEGNTFEGKTIKLDSNVDLYVDENGEPLCFEPIGSYRNDTPFKGTFDGQGNTIYNLNQNTWALDNGYYYGDLGLGLFGAVEDATIKELTVDGASISGESALCGTIAAVAFGECTFENITVKNSDVADYQYYAGGIVGWASGEHQYINCNIDESTTIGGQWGDFNNANGGVIGGASDSAAILLKDCTVACRIDAVNDVVSAYQWYSYRRSGMLIGDTGKTVVVDGTTYAAAPQLTCENVTVIYGDWANYHYCKFAGTGYPWVRVEAGTSVDAYSNVRYGHPTDANGNTVVDDNHVHNDGEAHKELIVFDQLYGGKTGDRYCTYGTATHDGVTVIYNNK